MPPPDTYECEIGSQSTMCQVYTWCISLITRAWKNRLYITYLLPPEKDYHVYIARSTHHYEYRTHISKSIGKKKQRTKRKRKEKEKKEKTPAWRLQLCPITVIRTSLRPHPHRYLLLLPRLERRSHRFSPGSARLPLLVLALPIPR